MKNNNYSYLKAVLVGFLSMASFTLEAASLYEVKIDAYQLNVREYPTVKSNIVGKLFAGTTTIASQSGSGGWYFVQVKEGAGYILSDHVKLIRVILTDNTVSAKK